jgi:hypothetical protein
MRNPGGLIFVLMLLYGAPLFARRASCRDHSRYWYSCADGLNAKGSVTILGLPFEFWTWVLNDPTNEQHAHTDVPDRLQQYHLSHAGHIELQSTQGKGGCWQQPDQYPQHT